MDINFNPLWSQKIRECGEAMGVSVDSCKEGRNYLLASAHERDRQNLKAFAAERIKQKRSREL